MRLTAAEVTELIDQVVGEASLYTRIQKGRDLRLRIVMDLGLDQRAEAPNAGQADGSGD